MSCTDYPGKNNDNSGHYHKNKLRTFKRHTGIRLPHILLRNIFFVILIREKKKTILNDITNHSTSSPCLSLVWNLWYTMGKLSLRTVEWLKDTFQNNDDDGN